MTRPTLLLTPDSIAAIARAAHNAHRDAVIARGDPAPPEWEALPEAARVGKCGAVWSVLADGADAETLHRSWVADRASQGWTHGAARDEAAKVSPDLVPWSDVPPLGKAKGRLFVHVVCAVAEVMGA